MSGKKDAALGHEIKAHLALHNVESPIDFSVYNSTTADEKQEIISAHMLEILHTLGFDMSNDSVQDTHQRVAKMWVKETMSGLDYNNFPKVMCFENKFKSAGMVVEHDVQSMSLCSHHLVTIDGLATVAYIPKDKVIGLSKINRVVEFFSRRPQEAERLTLQIYYALQYILGTDDIAVFINGVHYCVKSRGVGDSNSSTSTVKLGGLFHDDAQVRAEFYGIINKTK